MTEIILASTSQIRRKILIDCAVPHRAIAPGVDEAPIKAVMLGQGAPHAAIAAALAQAKAAAISRLFPEAIVIGADQVLSFAGDLFDKAQIIANAAENLKRLRGRTHHLLGAVSIQINAVEHRAIASVATLTCRDFSDDFWPIICTPRARRSPNRSAAIGSKGSARNYLRRSRVIISAFWACRFYRFWRRCVNWAVLRHEPGDKKHQCGDAALWRCWSPDRPFAVAGSA